MKIHTYLAAAALAALAAACQNDEPSLSYHNDPDAIRINPTIAGMNASPRANTTDAGDAWETGDRIGVKSLTSGVPAQKQTGYYRADASASVTTWTPCTATGTPASLYLVWEGDGTNTFEAWYPASAGTATRFDLPTDQSSLEKLKAADYMTAHNIEAKKGDDSGQLSFQMEHRLSMVTFNIASYDDQYTNASELKYTDVRVYSMDGAMAYNGTGWDEAGTSIDYISPYIIRSEGKENYPRFMAIVTPSPYSNTPLLTFNLNGVGNSVRYTGTFMPGKAYTFSLNVGKDGVKITGVTVKDWTTVELDEGFADEVFP